jgi:site-specific recombinase
MLADVRADATGIPERRAFGAEIHPDEPEHRAVAALRVHLARISAPDATLPARLDSLERIGRWLVHGPPPPGPIKEIAPVARLRLLVRALDRFPVSRARLSACLGTVLAETSGIKLFAEAGLPNDRGLGHETLDRVSRRLLPVVPDLRNLGELLTRIFQRERDSEWLARMPEALLGELADQLGDVWQPVRDAMADSIALICTRVSALGLSEDIRDRSTTGPIRESPFFRLPRTPLAQLPQVIADCRAATEIVRQKLETHGVSVDVVYCIDTIERALARIELLQPLVAGADDMLPAAHACLVQIAPAPVSDLSLRDLMRTNVRLLARKIIERAGDTGEHYVTATRREYVRMLGSAAGGGALTAITCVVKFLTKWGHFPLFVDGALSAANYATSFIVMQLLGFTLATKQPSMTAAHLAAAIGDKRRGDDRMDELVGMIARISRSQFAAACGNVLVVIPAAFAVNLLVVTSSGADFLDATTATGVIASFHPLHSGTLFFAGFTGVLLWMSSIGAGWIDNWAVYRRLPEAIAQHRWGRVVGRQRMVRVSQFLAHNISGFGGNITLGILLGMVPVFATFFGLPLDVRHVTLSTGSLTLAACALGPDVLHLAAFQAACVGILFIGLLNFGVSFVLALAVAFRAREVSTGEWLHLVSAVLRRLVRSPLEFVYPTKKSVAAAPPAAH